MRQDFSPSLTFFLFSFLPSIEYLHQIERSYESKAPSFLFRSIVNLVPVWYVTLRHPAGNFGGPYFFFSSVDASSLPM